MTGYVITAGGQRLQLPVALNWELEYTAGVPCDSFWLCCPWDQGQQRSFEDWAGFEAVDKGEVVFTGTPREMAERGRTITADYLRRAL